MKPSDRIIADAKEAWALKYADCSWETAPYEARNAFVLSALLAAVDKHEELDRRRRHFVNAMMLVRNGAYPVESANMLLQLAGLETRVGTCSPNAVLSLDTVLAEAKREGLL